MFGNETGRMPPKTEARKRSIIHAVRAGILSEGVYFKIRTDTTRGNLFEALVNKTRRTMTFGVQNGVQLARPRRSISWLRGAESTVSGIVNSRMLYR